MRGCALPIPPSGPRLAGDFAVRGPAHLRPVRGDHRRGAVGRRHRDVPPHAVRRPARAALRHGGLFRLPGDRRWPDRPARLHDQGRRWHAGQRRRAGHAGAARPRAGAATAGRAAPATCWWSAAVRPACPRPSPRPRRAPPRCCWMNARRPGGQYRQAAGRQPYRCRTRRAVPARRRAAPAAPWRRTSRSKPKSLVWGALRPAGDRRPAARPRGHLPAAPADPGARRA